jgi:hypothetical protein
MLFTLRVIVRNITEHTLDALDAFNSWIYGY